MNITSKLTKYSWMELKAEEGSTTIQIDVNSVREATLLKDQLIEVINDIDIYIEKQTKNQLT
jgi:hypothetical protein